MNSSSELELKGIWDKGFALDFHTVHSSLTGVDDAGKPMFSTERTEVGECVYRFKYMQNLDALPALVRLVKEYMTGIETFSCIIPVPPSKLERPFQPVFMLGKALSEAYRVPYYQDALFKSSVTEELKGVEEYSRRKELAEAAIRFNVAYTLKGKDVLLLDDVFQTGATLTVVTERLRTQGGARSVCVLALTRTRVKR